jgi:SAM-dependent methyltransferase
MVALARFEDSSHDSCQDGALRRLEKKTASQLFYRMSRIAFLNRVVRARLKRQERGCPYCRATLSELVGRKHLVIELRRCARCGLMFRWPKDSADFNRSFYQVAYRQEMVTELPAPAALESLKRSLFRATENDFSARIDVLKLLVPSGRVLDYGCSWGYGTFQMCAAGYDAIGFEISNPRSDFGRTRLGLKILGDLRLLLEQYRGSFDAIVASHVLEHLPDLSGVFERFSALLGKGGSLLIFVPNCGGRKAREMGVNWGPMCCEKHPLALDSVFFERALPQYGFTVRTMSDPYEPGALARMQSASGREQDLSGDELMVWAQKSLNSPIVS